MHRAAQEQSHSGANAVWCSMFELDPEDWTGLLRSGLELGALAREVRQMVEQLPADDDPDLMLEFYPQIETALARFPNVAEMTMFDFMEGVHPNEGLRSLLQCSQKLARRRAEPELSDDTIQKALALVRQAIAAVEDDRDLEPEVKTYVLNLLWTLEDALRRYNFSSIGPVTNAIDTVTGAVARRDSRIQRFIQRVETATKVAALFNSVAAIVVSVHNAFASSHGLATIPIAPAVPQLAITDSGDDVTIHVEETTIPAELTSDRP